MSKIAKTDNQLRGEIIRAGGMEQIWALEALYNRDSIAVRGEYRSGLERLAAQFGVERTETLPSPARAYALPYGPG